MDIGVQNIAKLFLFSESLALSVQNVCVIFNQTIGFDEHALMSIIWRALRATAVNGNCPLEKNSLSRTAESSVKLITLRCWKEVLLKVRKKNHNGL